MPHDESSKNFDVPLPQELDVVDILRYWHGHDDVPEDLSPTLAVAADEIAGLREENKYLRSVINDAEPKF